MLHQAKWLKCESTETPTTSAFRSLNSCILSLNEMISVGQTKVLKREFIFNHIFFKYYVHNDHIQIKWIEEQNQIFPFVIT